ncbi:MAG: amidohydrolase [Clostridia bacterium]|nr:amidohydrolase [Clostridia bacterium]
MRQSAFYNGKIYLERERFCEAVLTEDGIIQKTGTTEDILKEASPDCERVDLEGRTMVPGFNDTHMHLMSVGESLWQADVAGATSIDDVVERCRRYAREHPERAANGIVGSGWMEDLFTSGEKRPLTRFDLDRISTEVPVFLKRGDQHVGSGNSKLIEILRNFPEWDGFVENGMIECGEDGEPTGFFKEAGQLFCRNAFPALTADDYAEYLRVGAQHAASKGLTSVQSNDVADPVGPYDICFEGVIKAYDGGGCPVRYYLQRCFHSPDDLKAYLKGGPYGRSGSSNPFFRFGPLKLVCDGSLGGRTAFMLDEYCDKPGTFGMMHLSAEDLNEYCRIAAEHGIQVATHCIGDGALELTLQAYAAADPTGTNPNRNGIVHCQVSSAGQLDRIVSQNLYILAQPVFLHADIRQMETRVTPEKGATSYAFGSLHRRGLHVSYGTDSPIEKLDPFPNLYCAVTRQGFDGYPAGGWNPSECVDIYDAVDAYTIESAWTEFEEHRKGRIRPGYLADFTVCDRDIFTCPPQELLAACAVMTVVDGKVVYRKE